MADVVFVVDTGLSIINNRLKGTGTEPINLKWGTGGATVAVATDTALTTARAEVGANVSSSLIQTTTAEDTYQVVGTVTCVGTTGAINEVGLFDGSSVMFLRGTFDVINVNVGDSIAFTIKSVLNQAT